jgi:lysyl-tRNA synthetase class 2
MTPCGAPARWARRTTGAAAGLAGATLLAGVVVPAARWELGVDPAPLDTLPGLLAMAAGMGLVLVARGLARGSRRASQLTAALLGTVALAGALGGAAETLVLLEAVAGGALIVAAPLFPRGAATRPSRAAGALTVGGAATSYGVAMVAVLAADRAHTFAAALVAAAWLVQGLLRPGPARAGHSAAEHARAAAVVAAHARDSLDPFALREDKAFHFAHGGLLAYRTLRETAVVSGDPIGPPGTAAQILASFETFAAERGWNVVLTATSSRDLEDYRALGFRTLPIGEEAIVDPAAFTLEGCAMKSVRKAVRRVERHGWTVDIVPGSALDDGTAAAIAALEHRWRAGRPRLQGFAMTLGRLWGSAEDEDALYVIGRDEHAALGAFLRFGRYPEGLSLDVMRRLGKEPNGVNEALIVAAIEHARATGIREVSLNFAGFSHLMVPRVPLTRAQRLARRALTLAHGRFQLDRLVCFNEKFQPRWEPRHLVYRGALGLPRAGVRVLQAEAYVRGPRPRPVRDAWQPQPVFARVAPAGRQA